MIELGIIQKEPAPLSTKTPFLTSDHHLQISSRSLSESCVIASAKFVPVVFSCLVSRKVLYKRQVSLKKKKKRIKKCSIPRSPGHRPTW